MLIHRNSLLEAKKYRTPVDSLLAMVQFMLSVVSSVHAMSPCTGGENAAFAELLVKCQSSSIAHEEGAGQCTLRAFA